MAAATKTSTSKEVAREEKLRNEDARTLSLELGEMSLEK